MVFLLSLVGFHSLWVGVQLPQGRYVSYGRGYMLAVGGCNIGYTPMAPVPLPTPGAMHIQWEPVSGTGIGGIGRGGPVGRG
mgnify:CR=1 FL=1